MKYIKKKAGTLGSHIKQEGTKHTYKCTFCALTFSRKTKVKNNCKPYCSRLCVQKHIAFVRRVYPKVIGVCLKCKSDIVAKNASFNKPTRRYCSKSCKASIENKSVVWNFERRKKLSDIKKKKVADSGYVSVMTTEEKQRKSFENKIWREKVFERDNYTCQMCGQHGVRLNADHIKSFAKYPELRFDVSNGRTLCVDCHKKTDNWGIKAIL